MKVVVDLTELESNSPSSLERYTSRRLSDPEDKITDKSEYLLDGWSKESLYSYKIVSSGSNSSSLSDVSIYDLVDKETQTLRSHKTPKPEPCIFPTKLKDISLSPIRENSQNLNNIGLSLTKHHSSLSENERNCTNIAIDLVKCHDIVSEIDNPPNQKILWNDGLSELSKRCKLDSASHLIETDSPLKVGRKIEVHECALKLSQTTPSELYSQLSLEEESQVSGSSSSCQPLASSNIPLKLKQTITQFSNFRSQKIVNNSCKKRSGRDVWDQYFNERNILEQVTTGSPKTSYSEILKHPASSIRNVNKKMNGVNFKNLATLIVSTNDNMSKHSYGELSSLLDKLYEADILVERSQLPFSDTLIHWKTKISRKWNTQEEIWLPCKEHEVTENIVLVLLGAETALDIVNTTENSFIGHYKALQTSLKGVITPSKVIYLIQGLKKLKSYMYKNNSRKNALEILGIDTIEDSFVDLQMDNDINAIVNLTNNISDTTEYLIETTKQIALLQENRRYRDIIKDFGIEVKVVTGTSLLDTWSKILESIPGISSLKSKAILKKYPTIHSLIEDYNSCQSEKDKINLLSNIQVVSAFSNLSIRPRNLGIQLSKKIYHCIFSKDPSLTFS